MNKYRLIYQQGMRSALLTVTLPDQRIRLGASTAQMSYAFAISAFGPILGAPLGSIADRCVFYCIRIWSHWKCFFFFTTNHLSMHFLLVSQKTHWNTCWGRVWENFIGGQSFIIVFDLSLCQYHFISIDLLALCKYITWIDKHSNLTLHLSETY